MNECEGGGVIECECSERVGGVSERVVSVGVTRRCGREGGGEETAYLDDAKMAKFSGSIDWGLFLLIQGLKIRSSQCQ